VVTCANGGRLAEMRERRFRGQALCCSTSWMWCSCAGALSPTGQCPEIGHEPDASRSWAVRTVNIGCAIGVSEFNLRSAAPVKRPPTPSSKNIRVCQRRSSYSEANR
jgi:hypothetical protein